MGTPREQAALTIEEEEGSVRYNCIDWVVGVGLIYFKHLSTFSIF